MPVSAVVTSHVDSRMNVSQAPISPQNVSQIPIGPYDTLWRARDYYALPFHFTICHYFFLRFCHFSRKVSVWRQKTVITHTKDVLKVETGTRICGENIVFSGPVEAWPTFCGCPRLSLLLGPIILSVSITVTLVSTIVVSVPASCSKFALHAVFILKQKKILWTRKSQLFIDDYCYIFTREGNQKNETMEQTPVHLWFQGDDNLEFIFTYKQNKTKQTNNKKNMIFFRRVKPGSVLIKDSIAPFLPSSSNCNWRRSLIFPLHRK